MDEMENRKNVSASKQCKILIERYFKMLIRNPKKLIGMFGFPVIAVIIVVFVAGQVMDAVVYRFDYSRVALIVSVHHAQIAQAIGEKLDRGATYLHGEGSYTHNNTEVILTVVKKRQLAELKELVMEIDSNAFVIVQEAHQVLGDGFSRYSPDGL